MRKIAVIMVLALALLLMGLTLSASAVTIKANTSGEDSLDVVFNKILGTNYSLADLNALTPIETLSTTAVGGTYALTDSYFGAATFAGFTQNPGTNAAGSSAVTLFGSPFPTSSSQNNYITFGPGGLSFTPVTDGSGNFGFADQYSDGTHTGTAYTEHDLNVKKQLQGLIFEIGPNEWMVCFEDGQSFNGCLGDQDYNDLVLHVTRTFTPVPLPPAALLMGSGLLGLVGLGWRRRKTTV